MVLLQKYLQKVPELLSGHTQVLRVYKNAVMD